MTRSKALISYALIALALVGLFVVFIAFKGNAALIAALEAAGAVAAAGFAAIAATGSMRAAAESNATARRSREALARTMRPRIRPSVSRENGRAVGEVTCEPGWSAVDVTVVWVLTDRGPITERAVRLEPSESVGVDLKLPEHMNAWDALSTVWIEYQDNSRAGQWRDTWQVEAADGQGRLVLTHSELVD